MSTRKHFHGFLKIKDLREGAWVDEKMVSVYLDLGVGPFTLMGLSYHVASRSLRLNHGKRVKLKASYIEVIRALVEDEIRRRQKKVDKSRLITIL